jgi:phosphatidylserine/phosphatidylglycerophosphate/cardiolipin synthase-like enzyme
MRWWPLILLCACGPTLPPVPQKAAPSLPDGAGKPLAWVGKESLEIFPHAPGDQPRPSDACSTPPCTELLALIEGAQHSIDFAIYGLRGQPALLAALQAAQKRGVRVRGVVDRDAEGKNYYRDTDALVAALGTVRDDLAAERAMAARRKAFDEQPERCKGPAGFKGHVQCLAFDLGNECLIAAHASEDTVEEGGAIMHDKFFIVDGESVWTGSANISDSDIGGYGANLTLVAKSPKIARLYTREFELMYTTNRYHNEKPRERPEPPMAVGDAQVQVWFSPQDEPITRAVRPLIQRAQSRIDVAIFFLTHTGITTDLIAARRRGVDVRVIIDATGARNGYTKHELLRAAGIPVKVESFGGKMHAKAAAIDGRWVIGGSMNWTWAGEGGNDENTMIIESSRLAEQFHAWYDDLWQTVSERWAEQNPDPESWDSGAACADGIDNDFDGQADVDDHGCGPKPPPLSPLPPWKIVPKRGASCLDELDRL